MLDRGREEIRDAESKCNKCKRRKCKPAQQLMAPLPVIRLKEPQRLLELVMISLDDFLLWQGRGKARPKKILMLVYLFTITSKYILRCTARVSKQVNKLNYKAQVRDMYMSL